MPDDIAQIGIDIGTTYSRVAIFKDGRPRVLANELASNLTPSYVAYTDKLCHVGYRAKHQAAINVSNTVYGIRRVLGRLYNDPFVKKSSAILPYRLISVDDRPKIQVNYKNEEKTITPEEITALLIERMVVIGEAALGQDVKKAVITVPSQFTCCQRRAVKDAAFIVGIESVLINETTAAALAYAFERKSETVGQKRSLLVFNMGGGFTTATIVTVKNQRMLLNQECIKVRATAGDLNLGGDDFDNALVDYCCQHLQEKGIDLKEQPRALCRLRRACEKARRDLSFSVQTIIEVEDICSDIDFNMPITRAKFESICEELFKRAILPVHEVLDTNWKERIHEIVLVGGSTRMPRIQQQLRRMFPLKSVNLSMNQDEAAVIGAAVRIGYKDKSLKDILPVAFGVWKTNGKADFLLQRRIPSSFSKVYKFNTPCITFKILEGENIVIGQLDLTSEFHNTSITFEFKVDSDGILALHVEALGSRSELELASEKYKLSELDYDTIRKDFIRYKNHQSADSERIQTKDSIHDGLERLTAKLLDNRLSENEKKEYQGVHKNVMTHLEKNPNAISTELQKTLKTLQTTTSEIEERYQQDRSNREAAEKLAASGIEPQHKSKMLAKATKSSYTDVGLAQNSAMWTNQCRQKGLQNYIEGNSSTAEIPAYVLQNKKDEVCIPMMDEEPPYPQVHQPKSKKHCPEGPNYPKYEKKTAESRNVGCEVPLIDGLVTRFG